MSPRGMLLLLLPSIVTAASLRSSRALAQSKASEIGRVIGEARAASTFFAQWVGGLPKNLTKTKQDAVVKQLEVEVAKMSENVNNLKKNAAEEKAQANMTANLKMSMKGKDRAMLEKMDQWSARMNEKARISGLNVLSKLKNAIHLIKKGALAGNSKASGDLDKVLKQMTDMTR